MTQQFTYTSDFRQEFEAETGTLLRRRFLWLTGLLSIIFAVGAGLSVWRLATAGERAIGLTGLAWRTAGDVATGIVAMTMFVVVVRRPPRQATLLKMSFALVLVDGGIDLFQHALGHLGASAPGMAIYMVMPTHVIAAALIPWSPRQAARPMLPLIAVNGILAFVLPGATAGERVLAVVFSPLAAAPGIFVAWLKHARRTQGFKMRFLQSRYGAIRRELTDARRIHESMFPRAQARGPLRLDYRYQPMRQIGGDFLWARFGNDRGGLGGGPAGTPGRAEALHVLLLDVTGHGIAAALTVNRVFGEVERLFAENPEIGPGDVLRGLNRYVHLTLAGHSVYATALCVTIDPAREVLTYASGGHPPAFVRTVDGRLDRLDSTAFVLGACAAEDFDPEARSVRFGPGDALIAYTDGAIEARDEAGKMLGINGFQRLLASVTPDAVGGWSSAVLSAVERHRAGSADDDTLIVEVAYALSSRRSVRTAVATGPAVAAVL